MRLEAWDTNAERNSGVRPDRRGGEYAAYTPVAWGRRAQGSVARNEARVNGEGRARDLAPAVVRRTSPELPAAIRRLDDSRRDTPLLPPAPLASVMLVAPPLDVIEENVAANVPLVRLSAWPVVLAKV